jgi:hypothetical protein
MKDCNLDEHGVCHNPAHLCPDIPDGVDEHGNAVDLDFEDVFEDHREAEPEVQRLVIATGDYQPDILLFASGEDVERELGEHSRCLDDHDLAEAPAPGVWVWEGRVRYKTYVDWEGCCDSEVSWLGAYRAPTEDEWRAIRLGVSPWPAPVRVDDEGCAGCLSASIEHPCLTHHCTAWCRTHYEDYGQGG